MALVGYDEYGPPTLAQSGIFDIDYQKNKPKIIYDLGFVYAVNKNFRFGLHITYPGIGFYWKF